MRVRLAGMEEDGREARLEGLTGMTRVGTVLLLAAAALGCPADVKAALWSDSRVLRSERTLSEVGMQREGDDVTEMWLRVGEGGGGLLRFFGFLGRGQVAAVAV